MFHYNGRPISKQEMTEMLANRQAAVDLAKSQRQRERDSECAGIARREVIWGGLAWLTVAALILTIVAGVMM